jgi:hypothetical protein
MLSIIVGMITCTHHMLVSFTQSEQVSQWALPEWCHLSRYQSDGAGKLQGKSADGTNMDRQSFASARSVSSLYASAHRVADALHHKATASTAIVMLYYSVVAICCFVDIFTAVTLAYEGVCFEIMHMPHMLIEVFLLLCLLLSAAVKATIAVGWPTRVWWDIWGQVRCFCAANLVTW